MKLIDYNSSSLVIDNIEKVGNRIFFNITSFLHDERTDTNIKFETDSYINIDEWSQKSKMLLSEHKLELENFSFHADIDQRYYWDKQIFSNQNFFELSSNINKSRIKFLVESEYIFGREFYDEVSDVIQYQRDNCNTVQCFNRKDGLIHVRLKLVKAYTDGRCDLQLEVYSENFRIVRMFDDDIGGARYTLDQIQQFNAKRLDKFDIVGEFLNIDFMWSKGGKNADGSIEDFTWPGPNELVFDGCVDVEMENVDWDNLPLVPITYIPASEFKINHP